MDLNKLIYELREATNSISDDRRIDDRYVTQLINNQRAASLRSTYSLKPYTNTNGLTQDINIDIEIVSHIITTNSHFLTLSFGFVRLARGVCVHGFLLLHK